MKFPSKERILAAAKECDLDLLEFQSALMLQVAAYAIGMLNIKEKPTLRDAAKMADTAIVLFGALAASNPRILDHIYTKSINDRFTKRFEGLGVLKSFLNMNSGEETSRGDLSSFFESLGRDEKKREIFKKHYERAKELGGEGFLFDDIEIPMKFAEFLISSLPLITQLQEAVDNIEKGNERSADKG